MLLIHYLINRIYGIEELSLIKYLSIIKKAKWKDQPF